MKKYISLLIVLTISIFVGAGIVKAASPDAILSFNDGAFSYKRNTTEENGVKISTVTVFAKPTATDTVTGTQHFVVKLTKNKANDSTITVQDVSKVSDSINGKVGTIKQTDTGAEFDYTYNGTTAKEGEAYELFTLLIKQGPSSSFSADNSDCGGYISPDATNQNSTDNKGGSVPAYDTGFSIPVALIAVGSIAGLSIMASTSKKTKMHRI